MRTGRQAVLTAFNQPLLIREVAVRDPLPDEILVRVLVAGVCGSDIHSWRGEIPRNLPIVLGHEGIGVVAALGSRIDHDFSGEPLREGDRVYWAPARPCGHCSPCLTTPDLSTCEAISVYGGPGQENANSYADWAILPSEVGYFKVPDTLPNEALIAFGCALPTMLQAFERLGPVDPSERVVIQGCGPVGLAATLLCRLAGCTEIVAIDLSEERGRLARRFGAAQFHRPREGQSFDDVAGSLFDGRGASLVVEASGAVDAFAQGLQMLGRNGRYLLVGLWAGHDTVAIDPHRIVRNNLKIIGSVYASPVHYGMAVRVAAGAHGDWPLGSVVRQSFDLGDAQAALDAVRGRSPGKTIIRCTATS